MSNHLSIVSYLHCALCAREVAQGATDSDDPPSPQAYQQIEVGWTNVGLQVWCRRHHVNVIHIDFEGRSLPSDDTRAQLPGEGS